MLASVRAYQASRSSGLIIPFLLFRPIFVLQESANLTQSRLNVGQSSHDSEHLTAVDSHGLRHFGMVAARRSGRKMA